MERGRTIPPTRSVSVCASPGKVAPGELIWEGGDGAAKRSLWGPPMLQSQVSLPVHLSVEERDITARAAVRKLAFLRAEVAALPSWHPLHHEYRQQIRSLENRVGLEQA